MPSCVASCSSWCTSPRKNRKISNESREFFDEIEVFPVDDQVADIYGELKASIIDYFGPKEKAKRRRARIEELGFSENDLWIAAVAKRYGYTVVSCDSDFRRLQEIGSLKVESWLPANSVP
ncbi:type II toxin-antitoxin system VapC family toxin [Geobacter sp.]|uniref:type II toxin-antitoxin system VapC family toxin n=1 Tax=Geobacter sp. TaxID=46610 RepID=UPI00261FF2CA|nr:type II toxin-antitoxin system VapC family toxin [Geobacter sp.]